MNDRYPAAGEMGRAAQDGRSAKYIVIHVFGAEVQAGEMVGRRGLDRSSVATSSDASVDARALWVAVELVKMTIEGATATSHRRISNFRFREMATPVPMTDIGALAQPIPAL
ncbi:hypothetical protein [Mesorhizobium sp.]|uniref:hypothetical protein n=1 Tax=Mesorhizobium sp. TaxID=1871066 RepID=UPI000FE40984|nr:hypothetical protein [Mesorhizobium sp.]RWQ15241.1 MAG: hypothetical protein EOR92_24815 [Mesorhizobium sp.]